MGVFVHAIYPDNAAAERAVKALLDAHVAVDDVSVVMREGAEAEEVPLVHHAGIGRGAAAGAAVGLLLGGVLAATGFAGLIGIGPLMLSMQGALAGTATGAIAGVGWWQTGADFPHKQVDLGGILVGVTTSKARADALIPVLEATAGTHIGVTKQSSKQEAAAELGTRA